MKKLECVVAFFDHHRRSGLKKINLSPKRFRYVFRKMDSSNKEMVDPLWVRAEVLD